jgi:hypothetical protein
MTPAELASAYSRERERLNILQAEERAQASVVAELEQALFDAIENAGLRSVKVAGLGTFSLYDLAWAKIADRNVAMKWAEDNCPEVITLNHQQLSVMVRAALKEEGPMPEGVEFTTSRKISWRKA